MNDSGELLHWTFIMVMKPNANHSVKRLSSDGKKHTKVNCMPVLHAQCLCNTALNQCLISVSALTLKANQVNQGRVGGRQSEVLTTKPVEPEFTNSLFFKISKSFSFDVPDANLKENGCR